MYQYCKIQTSPHKFIGFDSFLKVVEKRKHILTLKIWNETLGYIELISYGKLSPYFSK